MALATPRGTKHGGVQKVSIALARPRQIVGAVRLTRGTVRAAWIEDVGSKRLTRKPRANVAVWSSCHSAVLNNSSSPLACVPRPRTSLVLRNSSLPPYLKTRRGQQNKKLVENEWIFGFKGILKKRKSRKWVPRKVPLSVDPSGSCVFYASMPPFIPRFSLKKSNV